MSKNVLIPANLLERIFVLMENWDFPNHHKLYYEYYEILLEIRWKMRKIELREAYADIVNADNEDAKHSARIDYLRLKRIMSDDYDEIPF